MYEANPLNIDTIDKNIKEFAILPTSILHEAQEVNSNPAQAKREEEAVIQYGPQYRFEG